MATKISLKVETINFKAFDGGGIDQTSERREVADNGTWPEFGGDERRRRRAPGADADRFCESGDI